MTTTGSHVHAVSLFAIGLFACGGAAPAPAAPAPASVVDTTVPTTSDATPPKVESADPNVRAVEAARPALDRCYEKARSANAALGRTTVTLKLRADDTGKVTKVDLDYTHKFDEDAKACMRDASFTVKLPAGTTLASVPVVFDTHTK